MKIGVVGTGYVGLATAVCLAGKNHSVSCVDKDEIKVAQLRKGTVPFFEPKLSERLNKNNSRLSFTTNLKEVIQNSEVIFIAVETPFEANQSNYRFLEEASIGIGKALAEVEGYRVIVVKSTVLPGITQTVVKPAILQHSQKDEAEIGFCMNPEFMRESTAVDDMEWPDRIVLGVSSERAETIMRNVYADFRDADILVTTLQTAEMIKYVSNAYFALNISYANEIAQICEKLPGVDSEEVLRGLLLDKRISPKSEGKRHIPDLAAYLKAGCGFGGSCFPKDLRALAFFQEKLGLSKGIVAGTIAINDAQIEHVFNLGIEKYLGKLKFITILGTAFKPGTDDIRESPGIKMSTLALEKGFSVFVHDPLALEKTKLVLGKAVHYCDSAQSAIKSGNIIFITTAASEYICLSDQDFESYLQAGALVVDCRNIYRNRPSRNWRIGIGIGLQELSKTVKSFNH